MNRAGIAPLNAARTAQRAIPTKNSVQVRPCPSVSPGAFFLCQKSNNPVKFLFHTTVLRFKLQANIRNQLSAWRGLNNCSPQTGFKLPVVRWAPTSWVALPPAISSSAPARAGHPGNRQRQYRRSQRRACAGQIRFWFDGIGRFRQRALAVDWRRPTLNLITLISPPWPCWRWLPATSGRSTCVFAEASGWQLPWRIVGF